MLHGLGKDQRHDEWRRYDEEREPGRKPRNVAAFDVAPLVVEACFVTHVAALERVSTIQLAQRCSKAGTFSSPTD
jgi:hypothetical protein